jgi:PIN domain nuclease of toxin-antitoxin system
LIGAIEPAVRYSYVLDSSAVIAFLNQEPGSHVVEPLFPVSVISTINWAEVITWLGTARNPSAVDLEAARNILDGRGLSTVEVTEAQAELAGLLNAQTRVAGLSLADRVALALAIEFDLPVLTSDRQWDRVNVGAIVRQIR